MTTSVRFSLSYDPFEWGLTAYKINIMIARKRIVSKTLRLRAKMLLHVWSYDSHDMTLSTE